VVFSHHDWLHKIKYSNDEDPSKFKLKKIEEFTTRRASAVVSGSVVECDQLRGIGCQNVHYIPLAYEPVKAQAEDGGGPRVVHLGGLGTTANRLGLERFFDVVFNSLSLKRQQMWVIGDMSLASQELTVYLQSVTTTGYVNDLNTVMRPFDIHVIPWEQATGQRTRLVCAFNYGQAVVAMRQAVLCFPEVIGDYNALLVDTLEEMPIAIESLLRNVELRCQLGKNARLTFEKHFTRKVLLPKYEKVIDSINPDRK
jgi:glycosyltransferase involved in cell wall biosynthesis